MKNITFSNISQTFNFRDIPQEAPTHKVAWPCNQIVLWYHVTNWIRYISTCRKSMVIKQGKVAYRESLLPIKSYNLLITWTTWDHVTNWKNYIFTLTRIRATKLGRVVTSRMRLIMQTPKPWPTSCFIWCILCFITLAGVIFSKLTHLM